MPLPMPLLPIKHGYFKSFSRESLAALKDRCRRFSNDSKVVQESTSESLFKDRYFVRGRGIGSGSGIATRFKDPTLVPN